MTTATADQKANEMTGIQMRKAMTCLARAKEVHCADRKLKKLHPTLKRGGDKRSESRIEAIEAANFHKAQVIEKHGESPRSWQRLIFIWNNLTKPSRERIENTWLANNQTGLLQLAKSGRKRQSKILDTIFDADTPLASVSKAIEFLDTGKLRTSEQKAIAKALKLVKSLPDSVFEEVMIAERVRLNAWLLEQDTSSENE